MKDLTQLALDAAVLHGASYADIRIILSTNQNILVKNGEVETLNNAESIGFGIRVIANGSWGFASSSILTKAEIKIVAKRAVEIAKASATLRKDSVRLAPEPVHNDVWTSPYLIDPFTVSLEEKLDLLFEIDSILRKDEKIKVAETEMSFWREHQWLATTEGTYIEQILLRSGGGYSATAVDGPNVQARSYPASFGGQYKQMGYEFILGTPFVENAERIREEAVALLSAPDCPVGDITIELCCILEHVVHIQHTADIPYIQILIEHLCSVKHPRHVRHITRIPGADILIEDRTAFKHLFHVKDILI